MKGEHNALIPATKNIDEVAFEHEIGVATITRGKRIVVDILLV